MSTTLPSQFAALEPWVADWAKASRNERYAVRLAKSMEEIGAFYDAVAAVADEAMDYLNALDINDLPDDATRLLQLLYSMILVSYAVNVFHQQSVPDAGSAFFTQIVEPAV
jgi:hypothetical protein